jgi:hypothetical protein
MSIRVLSGILNEMIDIDMRINQLLNGEYSLIPHVTFPEVNMYARIPLYRIDNVIHGVP